MAVVSPGSKTRFYPQAAKLVLAKTGHRGQIRFQIENFTFQIHFSKTTRICQKSLKTNSLRI